MKADALWITEPQRVEVRSEELPPLAAGQVLVKTTCSAISPGTERLFYLGKLAAGTKIDSQIAELTGGLQYPVKYGYAAVGQVVECGPKVDPEWNHRSVFAFHPHQSAFVSETDALIPIPDDLPPQQAAYLAHTETALNLVHDGAPLAGERVRVHGLGVVGLLTLSLLAKFPLDQIVAIDPIEDRRRRALERGATIASGPSESTSADSEGPSADADLTFELSGTAAGLDQAIHTTGFGGRIVVGSWYGDQSIPLHLDSTYHRSRLQLISSQVSTIAPDLSGRWTKVRRLQQALRLLPDLLPDRLVTHRFALEQAQQAYQLLTQPTDALGIILTYGD